MPRVDNRFCSISDVVPVPPVPPGAQILQGNRGTGSVQKWNINTNGCAGSELGAQLM